MPYYRAVPEGLLRIPAGGFGQTADDQLRTNIPNIGGGLTEGQKAQACATARAWLAQHPVVASLLTEESCGICPTCPAAEDCLSPEAQGYILPESCPAAPDCPAPLSCEAQGYVVKAEEEGGIAWWWLLLAAGGGSALGYALGSKKKAVGI